MLVITIAGFLPPAIFKNEQPQIHSVDSKIDSVTRPASNASSDLFSYVKFSIPDYTFDVTDFHTNETTSALFGEDIRDKDIYLGVLFTNSTISMHTIGMETGTGTPNNQIELKAYRNYIADNSAQYGYKGETVINADCLQNKVEASAKYINYNQDNVFTFSYNQNAPKVMTYKALIRRYYIDPGTNTGAWSYTTYVFNIVQTSAVYNTNSGVTYSFETTPGTAVSVSDMIESATYKKVNLTVTPGTQINPTIIDLNHNGEHYEIRNINGYFYNNTTRELLTFANTPENTIPLDKSGVYDIVVRDRTGETSSPSANKKYDSFMIDVYKGEFRAGSVFLTATTTSGDRIANGETTNEDVSIRFFNITPTVVDKIVVSETTFATGNVYTTDTVYSNEFKSAIPCENDGLYQIKIYFKPDTGTGITPQTYTYRFTVIKDIRTNYSYYTIELNDDGSPKLDEHGNTIPVLKIIEIEDNQLANKINNCEVTETITLTYGNGIYKKNEYHYTVRLAKSAPEISGVLNNQTLTGSATVTIKGVGKISVTITENGQRQNPVLYNSNDKISFSKPGKYTITIVDEMGTSLTKNFTINVQINGAGIALLVVGGVLVALGLLYVIKSRSKVSVR